MVLTENEEKVIKAIRLITSRGNDAEVRANKNGDLKVIEIKKNIVVG